jgi:peptidoglycan/LPS O-acetylase OafA/YrhL
MREQKLSRICHKNSRRRSAPHHIPTPPEGFAHIALYMTSALLLTILLSGISYHWLERPFLQWKKRFTFVPNRPV